MSKNNDNLIRFPIRRKSSAKPPRPPRGSNKTAAASNHEFVFVVTYSGLPARMTIEVTASNYREATGVAYLIAERFSTSAIATLKGGAK